MEARRQDELWQRKQMVDAAQTKRDSLALVLQERDVTAAEDGIVEALSVKIGEVVQSGQPLGKIVPVDSPLQVVSFLAEKDRAFAKPGDEVRLELDQLPHAEYGTLRAKVVRIGDDLASAQEIREALGEEQKLEAPSYRVELQITDSSAADAAQVKLRTGALMNVRYTLRTQKLITMVFTPLKRWFR
jgi:multidrug resistance efflux pump